MATGSAVLVTATLDDAAHNVAMGLPLAAVTRNTGRPVGLNVTVVLNTTTMVKGRFTAVAVSDVANDDTPGPSVGAPPTVAHTQLQTHHTAASNMPCIVQADSRGQIGQIKQRSYGTKD